MSDNSEQNKLALAFSAGTVVVSNIVGGVVVGYLLDRWLKTGPWLLLGGIVLGAIAAFASLGRILSRLNQK